MFGIEPNPSRIHLKMLSGRDNQLHHTPVNERPHIRITGVAGQSRQLISPVAHGLRAACFVTLPRAFTSFLYHISSLWETTHPAGPITGQPTRPNTLTTLNEVHAESARKIECPILRTRTTTPLDILTSMVRPP